MWPSITYQPFQLARAMFGAKPWREPPPLLQGDLADWRSRTKSDDPSIVLPVLPSS
jgi:hypothetical protein